MSQNLRRHRLGSWHLKQQEVNNIATSIIYLLWIYYTTIIEELLKLWVAHQNQRTEMSALFRQRLCRELEALEKEIKLTQTSEEKMSSSLKVGFKTVSKSLQKQQNQ